MVKFVEVVLAVALVAGVVGCESNGQPQEEPSATVGTATSPTSEPSPLGFRDLGPGVREAAAEPGMWIVRTGTREVTMDVSERVQVTATGTAATWDALLFSAPGSESAALVIQPVEGVVGDGGQLEEMPSDPIEWLGTVSGVEVLGQQETSVGGRPAVQVDVRLADGVAADGSRFVEVERPAGRVVIGQLFAIEGNPEGFRTVQVEAGETTRLWVVEVEDDGPLVAFAPVGDDGSVDRVASDVIDGLEFRAPPS